MKNHIKELKGRFEHAQIEYHKAIRCFMVTVGQVFDWLDEILRLPGINKEETRCMVDSLKYKMRCFAEKQEEQNE